MRSALRLGLAMAVLMPALGLAGCGGVTSRLFGTQGEYLLYGYDVVTVPGREVDLRARIQKGTFLGDVVNEPMRFEHAGREIGTALTDDEGMASVRFTPMQPRDYVIDVIYQPVADDEDEEDLQPIRTQLLVACRTSDQKFVVVDLDKTLVESGFHTVLAGDPKPMPGSVGVMRRLAKDFSIIYLTHRPDYLGGKSEAWLVDQGYPAGPMVVSNIGGLIEGNLAFKGQSLQNLKQDFRGLQIGIGDKISDVQAYTQNGLRGFLIYKEDDGWDDEDYSDFAADLNQLPDNAQIVTSWRQIEKVLYGDASYPRSEVQRLLLQKASRLQDD